MLLKVNLFLKTTTTTKHMTLVSIRELSSTHDRQKWIRLTPNQFGPNTKPRKEKKDTRPCFHKLKKCTHSFFYFFPNNKKQKHLQQQQQQQQQRTNKGRTKPSPPLTKYKRN